MREATHTLQTPLQLCQRRLSPLTFAALEVIGAEMMNEDPRSTTHTSVSPEARYVITSIVSFWTAFYLLSTARAYLLNFDALFEASGRRLIVVLGGTALFFLLWAILHLLRRGPILRTIIIGTAVSLPVAIAYGALNWLVFYAVDPASIQQGYVERWGADQVMLYSTIDATFSWYFFFAGWTLAYAALLAMARSKAAHAQSMSAAITSHDAQMRALRYQLNPHFLFNTLNVLASLVMEDRKDDADQMIVDLAAMLRLMLDERASDFTTLEQELAWQRAYLELEARRFEGRMKVELFCDQETKQEPVPLLITQPLAENAVRHGLRNAGHVTVAISAKQKDGELVITFENEIDPVRTASASAGHGIGLSNIRERLALIYGSRAYVETSYANDRFRATIHLPKDAAQGCANEYSV